MDQARDSATPMNTFVVRFWRQPRQDEIRWHGQVLHIQSGETAAFADVEALVSFMEQWVRLTRQQCEAGTDIGPPG